MDPLRDRLATTVAEHPVARCAGAASDRELGQGDDQRHRQRLLFGPAVLLPDQGDLPVNVELGGEKAKRFTLPGAGDQMEGEQQLDELGVSRGGQGDPHHAWQLLIGERAPACASAVGLLERLRRRGHQPVPRCAVEQPVARADRTFTTRGADTGVEVAVDDDDRFGRWLPA